MAIPTVLILYVTLTPLRGSICRVGGGGACSILLWGAPKSNEGHPKKMN